jgi:adenylate kinase family enzyme
MQPSVTNAKIGWLSRKVKGCVRTALNQANRRLLLINVPKRLALAKAFRRFLKCDRDPS